MIILIGGSMKRWRWILTGTCGTWLIVAFSGAMTPSMASSGGRASDFSQPAAKGFDPVTCYLTEPTGVFIGDVVSCVSPEPDEGSAAGTPGGDDPERFQRQAGDEYAGVFGEPDVAPAPGNCTEPVRGTYTQDQGVLNKISEHKGRRVFEMTFNTHYASGFGEGGRSVLMIDVWPGENGTTVFAGRELYEGTIGGRTGSLTIWNYGYIEPTGRVVGRAASIAGTEGLRNFRFQANFTALSNKGGHWTDPSWMCFTD